MGLGLFRQAQGVTEWLDEFENDVIQIPLPLQSPDLTPTAHLWEILDQCIASLSSKQRYSTTVYAEVLSCYSTLSSHTCKHTLCTSYLNTSWLILFNHQQLEQEHVCVFNVHPWYVLISVYLSLKAELCLTKLIYIWTWQLALSESLGHLGPSFHLFSEFSFLGRDIDIATATSAALSEAFWIVTEALIQRRWCKCTRWGTRFQIKMKQLPSCRTVIFLSFFCQTLCHLKWYQLSSNSALALLSQFTIFLMTLPLSSAHIMNNKTDAWQYLWISSFSL